MKFGQVVGKKAKGRLSKRVFQKNKARQIFRKTNISYPLIPPFSLITDEVIDIIMSDVFWKDFA